MTAEVDGYERILGDLGDPYAFEPPLSTSAGAAGVASVAFFPLAYAGDQAVQWDTESSSTAQGAGFTVACIPGRQYTSSIYVWQATTSTQQITIDGTTTGTTLTIPLAWTRLSVTFTASQPSHSVTVQTSGTAVPGAVFVDNIQHEPGSSATTFSSSGTTAIYGVFGGYVERWPSAWDHGGFRGRAEIAGLDALGVLNKTELSTEYRNAVLADAPAYYWALSEPSGTSVFVDTGGNGGPSLAQMDTTYGAATTVAAGTALNIAGDPSGTGVQIDGQNTGSPSPLKGSALDNHPQGAIMPTPVGSNETAWGVTLAMWFVCPQTTVTVATGAGISLFGVYGLVLSGGALTEAYPLINLMFNGDESGTLALNAQTAPGNGPFAVSAGTYVNGGTTMRLVVGVISQSGGTQTATLYVDGAQVGTDSVNVVTSYGTATPDFRCVNVTIGGDVERTDSAGPDATYGHCAAWNRALSADEIAELADAGAGYVGETSGERIARYLGYGYVGATDIDTGLSTMGVSDLTAGTSTLIACQNVTATESGNFWAVGTGQPTFTGRDARYLQTASVYTFGEDTAGGEYPYQDGIGFDLDPTFLYNDVTVSQSGGITARAIDAASKLRYFPNSYSLTVNCEDPNEAIDHATYILNQHSQPRQRVASITLDPASYPTLWPVALGLEIGTRVTVKRRATGGSLVMSGDYFIEAVGHDVDMDGGTWFTTVLMSPVDLAQVGILGDTTYGRIGSDGAELVSSITSSATTATVSTTGTTVAASTWTTSSTEAPFNALIDTETVSVTAVANLLTDTFTRTTANGWGTADTGQSWTRAGGAAGDFSTNGSVGQIANNTVNAGRFMTTALAVADVEVTATITVPELATGAAMNAHLVVRFADSSNYYRLGLIFQTTGLFDLQIIKVVGGSATTLATYTAAGAYGTATQVSVRAKILGSGLYANAWLATASELPGWMLSTTDTTDTAITAAGGVGVRNQVATGNTNVSPTFSFDNITTPTPQTFTLVRPTDGSAAAHSAGADVQVVSPFVLAF